MQLTILQASEYAFNILEKTTTLSVHSVYRKAVNLKAGNQLLTLQPRGSVLSPISMITACTEGELAELPFAARKTLSVTLKTEHTSRQDLFLSARKLSSHVYTENLHKKIRQAIAMAENSDLPPHMRGVELILNQPDLAEESLYMNAVQTILLQFRQAIGDSAKMADTLCRLIGLGIGLTPSGDDFLCGFLAGLRMSSSVSSQILTVKSDNFRQILEKKICSHLNRTNEISAAFLHCAALGQFSIPIHLLLSSEITAEQIYQAFSGIGHSSGISTLCGHYASSECCKQMPDSHSRIIQQPSQS